jgi:predicted hydrocarbon binding protein
MTTKPLPPVVKKNVEKVEKTERIEYVESHSIGELIKKMNEKIDVLNEMQKKNVNYTNYSSSSKYLEMKQFSRARVDIIDEELKNYNDNIIYTIQTKDGNLLINLIEKVNDTVSFLVENINDKQVTFKINYFVSK